MNIGSIQSGDVVLGPGVIYPGGARVVELSLPLEIKIKYFGGVTDGDFQTPLHWLFLFNVAFVIATTEINYNP